MFMDFKFEEIDVYLFSRMVAASFLILNSLHRVLFPQTGTFYMPAEVFSVYPLSQKAIVFLVMAVSLVCAFLIIIDRYTVQASAIIASGILVVVVVLLLQTSYIGLIPSTNEMLFFDVAMRDLVVVAFFVNLSILAKRRKATG